MAPIDQLMALTPRQKKILLACLLTGSVGTLRYIQGLVRWAQKEQRGVMAEADGLAGVRSNPRKPRRKVQVDQVFAQRLHKILKVCMPGWRTHEAQLLAVQTALLVARTLFTDLISRIEARAGRHLIAQDYPNFFRGLMAFALVAIPSSAVNAGLKLYQKRLALAWQRRLTLQLHRVYCTNRAYYAAAVLGGLQHADQRITEDVERFCSCLAELHSYTFKPLLDVLLFTHSLSNIMGYRSQFALYAYYIATAALTRVMSPPLAQMTAAEATLSGSFRSAHQRLVSHWEEIAFNDPPAGAAEQLVLNRHLHRLLNYTNLTALQRFFQQLSDSYFIKYGSTVVALMVYAAPSYLSGSPSVVDTGQSSQNYIRALRLLQNTSKGIGDLVLVYKRINTLAGHTARVAELMEQVSLLSREDVEHKEQFRRNVSAPSLTKVAAGVPSRAPSRGSQVNSPEELQPPLRYLGASIKFDGVALDAPDGTPLVRDLGLHVAPGDHVIIMGPNGSGKSSLFRVLAGLWPLMAGAITTPPPVELMYLAQRPYMVTGSLRDQVLYPQPPQEVWQLATRADRQVVLEAEEIAAGSGRRPHSNGDDAAQHVTQRSSAASGGAPDEVRLLASLAAVELEYLLKRGRGWDEVCNWDDTLSGGEKQRLAVARVLYRQPRYAILDECTSAVSAEGEVLLYKELVKAGITLLSIGHRPSLRSFHHRVLHFKGALDGSKGWEVEQVQDGEKNEQLFHSI